MADWEFLNKHRITSGMGPYNSTPEDGFNGAFHFAVPGEAKRVFCICSDGLGWKHVSVSFGRESPKPPSWSVMCHVKDLFFDEEEWVMQYHPPKSKYVNNHPGCLHLWRPTDTNFPVPGEELVGIKELGTLE